MTLRSRLWTVAAACGATILTGLVGLSLGQNANPQQPPTVTPQDLAAVDALSSAYRHIAETVSPAVVKITVTKTLRVPNRGMPFGEDFLRRFFEGRGGNNNDQNAPGPDNDNNDNENTPGPDNNEDENGPTLRQRGTGSGVIIEITDGMAYILTNNHVAGGASEMIVQLADGRQIRDAKLVGADPNTDVAVVKINGEGLKAARWGDSSKLQQGDLVVAFGSPFGFVGSMTHGIVSALHREAGILGQYGYENFIQVDAPINPGNSGGPLVNMRGEVVGVNTAIATASGGSEGIGFAIPSNQAKQIYQILREKGKVVRGWLGVEIADVSKQQEAARSVGYQGKTGVLVAGVLRASPATGKLQPGDVITGVNNKPVEDVQDLRNAIATTAPNTEVGLQVVRNGQQQNVQVKVGEQPGGIAAAEGRGPAEGQTSQTMGMRLRDMNNELAQRYGVPANTGALVTAVRPDSIAAQAGIQPGDVITRVDNQAVNNAQEANAALGKADLKKGIRLMVTNREGSKMVFMQSER